MREEIFKENILPKDLEEEMKDSYLSYAMSVIVGRALPDIRDGLKPVQRRILYTMHQLHLKQNQPYKKCARIVGECFVKDTLISTFRGLIPIQEIQKGDYVFTQKGIRKVKNLYYMPPRPLLKIVLENGLENIATFSQKFKVFTEDLRFVFKEARDLKRGDYIVVKSSFPSRENYVKIKDLNVDENIAYLLGLLMSDGWVEKGPRGYYRLGFCSQEKEVLERINKILKDTFGFKEKIMKQKKGVYYIRINKYQINKKLVESFSLQGLSAVNKFIPSSILRSPSSVIYAFLSGLIEGDGSIHKSRQALTYCSVSKKLISQLQVLLLNMGVISYRYSQKVSPHKLNGRWIKTNFTSYTLEIRGGNFKKLINNLTFASSKEEKKEKEVIQEVPSKYEEIPFLGRRLFEEFQEEHPGGGWYYDEEKKEKFRSGIKYENGIKIRYASNLLERAKVYSTTVKKLNIFEKAKRIDCKTFGLLREIIENNLYFIPVKEIKSTRQEETYDIEVEGDHEFIANGMLSHNCLGKFHPHGDAAVYDALVRMGQDFSLRYPLIDAQGNFGSIDGDPPAAMRYTEARLAPITDYLLADIDKDTVNFFPNFDNSLSEPEMLPAILPNLLINGASGIAVGMATNIPPHNLGEVCDALTYLIDHPEATVNQLYKIIKGPDFPTGGLICGKEGILQAYKEGKGKLILRGRATIEHEKNRTYIVISEIPYQVNKANLIESIANLINSKKIEGIGDLRDESDKEGIRIVIELRRDTEPQIILNQLYKHTQLETTFGVIALALVNRRPQILNLKDFLTHHLHFRKEIIKRRTKFELDKAQRRAHILEGLKIALKFLDKVIELIKKSKTTQEAKQGLIKKFSLTEIQAQSILEMQLQRLCALERKKIDEEYLELIKKIEYYNLVLSSEKKQEELIKEELKELKEKFADPRRTEIIAQHQELEIEDLIVEEDVVVTITGSGYIKRQPISAYRRQKRGGRGITAITTKEEDFVEHMFVASSKDTLLIFTSTGKAYPLKTYQIPTGSRVSRGRAIVNLLHLTSKEKITAVLAIKEFDPQQFIFMATQQGLVKRCPLNLFSNLRKSGIYAITLTEGDSLIGAGICGEREGAILVTKQGLAIHFKIKEIRPTGRQSRGVRGIRLARGDFCIGMVLVDGKLKKEKNYLVTATEKGFAKRTDVDQYRLQSRGGKGIINIKLSSKIGEVKGVALVHESDEIMCITQKGVLIRTKVKNIRLSGRATQGVRIINLDKDDRLSTIARIIPEE